MDFEVKGFLQSNTIKGVIIMLVTYVANTWLGFADAASADTFANEIYNTILAIGAAISAYGLRNAVGAEKVSVKPIVKS